MNFLSYYKALFVFSGVILLAGIISLAVFGLEFGLDFKGGSLSEIEFKQAFNLDQVRQVLDEEGIKNFQVQTSGADGVLIRTGTLDQSQHEKLITALKTKVGDLEEKQFQFIGPVVGQQLRKQAFYQLGLVSLGIILYIAYAFRRVSKPLSSWQFGIAAIVALLHDLLIVLGIFSILGHFKGIEIDSLFVTAMLTVLGFSVHDTIVMFDRIRENLRIYSGQSLDFIVNHSISQTLVRSLNTSLTVLFVLLAMLLFGGETIKYFVLALFIGVLTGTYSSISVASPILVLWQRWKTRKA